MMKRILLVSLLIIAPKVTCAQESETATLRWDLTYMSVLSGNKVGPDAWVRKWLGPNYESPIKQAISTWKHGPIESAILIEFPAFHAGEHITLWFVRTSNKAYYIEVVEDDPPRRTQEAVKTRDYDRFLAVILPWRQAQPRKPERVPDNGVAGYIGFLSVYDRSKSRQMLLTMEDFVICHTKKCDRFSPGRMAHAITSISRFKV